MTFNVAASTEKALKLTDGNVTFWIQRRWLREDGTLTPKGQESHKAAQEKAAKGFASDARAISLEVQRETEKAVLIEYCASYKGTGGPLTDWMPKSAFESVADGVLKPWGFKMLQEKVAGRLGGIPRKVKIS